LYVPVLEAKSQIHSLLPFNFDPGGAPILQQAKIDGGGADCVWMAP